MMKKVFSICTILIVISLFFPNTVFAEDLTYGKILDDLAKAQKELDANNKEITDKENQIIQNNKTIQSLKKQIEEMSKEVVVLQQEIADSNIEIENKKEQTKDLISYLQMSQGENIYLEYVFGGDSITDLIYRLSIVEQITEYNENMVKELEELITSNEKRKVELGKKQKEYEQRMVDLNNQISKLTSSIAKSESLSPGLEQEVKSKQALVDYYKSQGCKNRGDIIGIDCAVTSSNAIFTRPMETGYVTSFVGYRWGSFHRGLDMGSSLGKNTPLYSIGNGVIVDIWQDGNGAKCVTIQYKTTNGKYYTAIYAHLSRYESGIYKGMQVNSNTVIGYMGDTGYAFGVHLHLELYPCILYGDSNCRTWGQYTQFAERQFNQGFKGAESVISFPSGTYQTWYTK